MNILIPMAGAGQRFRDANYAVSKPALLTTDRRTGRKVPMVVCATMDLPGVALDGRNLIYIDRDFHQTDGTEAAICDYYPKAQFITVDHLTEGQASTCLLAKEKIDTTEELLIAGCDNGMVLDGAKFNQLKQETDALVFTYRHNEAVMAKPDAYGWVMVDAAEHVTGLSIKKAISNQPMEDHAIVATFWFRHGQDFVRAAQRMIDADDRINGEFYVDEVLKHGIDLGLRTKVFEIDRYIGWGTPKDYEDYEKTLQYWRNFVCSDGYLGKRG